MSFLIFKSERKLGTITMSSTTLHSILSRILIISSRERFIFKNLLMKSGSKGILVTLSSELSTIIVSGTISPAPSISINSQARFKAGMQLFLSRPFSKRELESVRKFCSLAAFRTAIGSKIADSSTIVVESSATELNSPPITPAKAIGFLLSAITRLFSFNLRSIPSRVVINSPLFAVRTLI